MPEQNRVDAKYICLDIVGYSSRDEGPQLEVRATLDEIVKSCVAKHAPLQDEKRRVYIPTGDGMCIALLDTDSTPEPERLRADLHLQLALDIIKAISRRNAKTAYRQLQFEVRVGVHAQTDYEVTDINGNRNLAGPGINTAFRVMNIGDGGQILVSQEVFNDLIRKFRFPFRRYDVKVRHDVPLSVYQFIGGDDGLNKDMPDAVREQERAKQAQTCINVPASDLGLTKIYKFRNDESVSDLCADINAARRRVWLLGVGLQDNFSITDPRVISLLNRKIDEHVDVSILLLDGFRSPAIFRALLESDHETSRAIVEADRRRPNLNDPYLAHRVFRNFEAAYDELAKHPNFKSAVRFYGHTPVCWLAIVDDKAYFQPYTFGDISDDPQVGYQMPVIRLQGDTTPFRILEDHYSRLWMTSDTDMFQTGIRLKARAEIIWKTFKKRDEDGSKWFEHVHGILHNEDAPGIEKRIYLRLPCISPLVSSVTWEDGVVSTAKVVNFSLEGVLLELVGETPESPLISSLPLHHTLSKTEIRVFLDIEPEGGWEAFRDRYAVEEKYPGMPPLEAVEHAVSAILETAHEFRYIRRAVSKSKPHRPRVALQTRRVQPS